MNDISTLFEDDACLNHKQGKYVNEYFDNDAYIASYLELKLDENLACFLKKDGDSVRHANVGCEPIFVRLYEIQSFLTSLALI